MLALLSSALALRVPAPRMVSSWYDSGVRLSGAAVAEPPAAAVAAPAAAPSSGAADADLDKVIKRCEFWSPEVTTKKEVINVLGRWETADQWMVRSKFTTVNSAKETTWRQAATEERYEMAKKLGYVERLALAAKVHEMPFTNARLAASVGMTVDDFNAMKVERAAVNVVFDAIANSKNGMLPQNVVDERRAGFFTADGGLDDNAFEGAIKKGRGLVILSWFLLGKGQVLGVVIGLKVLFDKANLWDKINLPPGFEYGIFAAGLAAAVFAAVPDENEDDAYYPEIYGEKVLTKAD